MEHGSLVREVGLESSKFLSISSNFVWGSDQPCVQSTEGWKNFYLWATRIAFMTMKQRTRQLPEQGPKLLSFVCSVFGVSSWVRQFFSPTQKQKNIYRSDLMIKCSQCVCWIDRIRRSCLLKRRPDQYYYKVLQDNFIGLPYDQFCGRKEFNRKLSCKCIKVLYFQLKLSSFLYPNLWMLSYLIKHDWWLNMVWSIALSKFNIVIPRSVNFSIPIWEKKN